MTIDFIADLKYRDLSNFARLPFYYESKRYLTVEHAFQALKMQNPEDAETIREAYTPGEAKKLGRRLPMAPDWDNRKLGVMRTLLRAKFDSWDRARYLLLETGDEKIIEGAHWDGFWGTGPDGKGANMMGKLLMELRAVYRGKRQ